MSLQPGTRIGPYEVLAPLGAGGMGEVYRARDTALGRDVAIKILPAAVAADPDRLARFAREATTLAALNHPNISQVYGFEQSSDTRALVMELVEGEDLAQRLVRGPLPLDEALPIARQIAEALEAAHDAGIVHRDLKPANIKVRSDGTVKVLDFGLAKALESPGSAASSLNSPTMTSPAMTEMGMILGTAGYMAPEQARGRVVDRRADIWAFGVVVFEMLTGKLLFASETVSDTVAAVLTREIDWGAVPVSTPPAIRELLRRCLERDPRRRLQAIGEARLVLEDPARTVATSVVAPKRPVAVAWIAGIAAAVALFAGGWLARPAPRQDGFQIRKVDLAINQMDVNRSRVPVISPDGSRVVLVAGDRLRVRRLDSLDSTELPESDGVSYVAWSPDSRFVAYVRRDRVWKVPVEGGRPTELGPVPRDLVGSAGAAWTNDGTLVIAGSDTTGLWAVSADGGTGRQLLPLDPAAENDFHEISALPNGRGVLFTVHPRNRNADTIAVFDGSSRRVVLEVRGETLRSPVYSKTGHLIYERETNNPGIWAVPFSLERLEVTGSPVLVVPGGSSPSLSSDGTLCFTRPDETPLELVRVSRSGMIEPIGELPGTNTSTFAQVNSGTGFRPAAGVRISPDGSRVAVNVGVSPGQLMVVDLARDAVSRVATGTFPTTPVWSPGGDRLIYGSARDARSWNVWFRRADGAGDETRVTTSDEVELPMDVSPDGVLAISHASGPSGNLLALPLDASTPARPLFASQTWGMQARFSPDGRWLAYESVESGRTDVYVRPFPAGDQRVQISTGGGEMPVWRNNEILYIAGAAVSAVSVKEQSGTLSVSKPATLFSTGGDSRLGTTFDVMPDGQHLVMVRSRGSQHLSLIFNWQLELEKAVAPKR